MLSDSTWDYYYLGEADNTSITIQRRGNEVHTRYEGQIGGRALEPINEVKTALDANTLDDQTVIMVGPPFVHGSETARNLSISIRHPINAYPTATLMSISVAGQSAVIVDYDHRVIHQDTLAEVSSAVLSNIWDQEEAIDDGMGGTTRVQAYPVGSYIPVDIRLITGRGADTVFLRTVEVLVVAAGGDDLSDEQIGDKAFSNPPSDLTNDEKGAVRTAIGVGGTSRSNVVLAAIAGLDNAGATSVVLPSDYTSYKTLSLGIWDNSQNRATSADFTTVYLAAQTSGRAGFSGLSAGFIVLGWNSTTRTLTLPGGANGDAFLFAELHDGGPQGPAGTSIAKATNPDVDAVGSTDTDLDAIQATARASLDDEKYTTVRKVTRLLQRVLKKASRTQLGTVLIARAEDTGSTETDTSRVPDVVGTKQLIERLASAHADSPILFDEPPGSIQASADNRDKILFRVDRLYRNQHINFADPTATYRDFATSDLPSGYSWGGAVQINPTPSSVPDNRVIYSIPANRFERKITGGGRAWWVIYSPANWRGAVANESAADSAIRAVGDIVFFGGKVQVAATYTARTPEQYHWVAIEKRRFESTVGASPAILPEGSQELEVIVSTNTDTDYVPARILLSSVPVTSRRFFFRGDQANEIEVNLGYTPGTRTLVYSTSGSQGTSGGVRAITSIKVIGEA